MAKLRISSARRWPFWLLIAAWLCANTPQVAVLHGIFWVNDAAHFTHQERLTRSVAALLAGHAETDSPERLDALAAARRAPPPVLPAEALVKKLVIFAEPTPALVWAAHATRPAAPTDELPPNAPVADVPSPPPRTATA